MLNNMGHAGTVLRRGPKSDGKCLVLVVVCNETDSRAALLMSQDQRVAAELSKPLAVQPLIRNVLQCPHVSHQSESSKILLFLLSHICAYLSSAEGGVFLLIQRVAFLKTGGILPFRTHKKSSRLQLLSFVIYS